jgi:hypothetical protein
MKKRNSMMIKCFPQNKLISDLKVFPTRSTRGEDSIIENVEIESKSINEEDDSIKEKSNSIIANPFLMNPKEKTTESEPRTRVQSEQNSNISGEKLEKRRLSKITNLSDQKGGNIININVIKECDEEPVKSVKRSKWRKFRRRTHMIQSAKYLNTLSNRKKPSNKTEALILMILSKLETIKENMKLAKDKLDDKIMVSLKVLMEKLGNEFKNDLDLNELIEVK